MGRSCRLQHQKKGNRCLYQVLRPARRRTPATARPNRVMRPESAPAIFVVGTTTVAFCTFIGTVEGMMNVGSLVTGVVLTVIGTVVGTGVMMVVGIVVRVGSPPTPV